VLAQTALVKSNEIAIKQIVLNRDVTQNLSKERIIFIASSPNVLMFVVIEFPVSKVFIFIEQSLLLRLISWTNCRPEPAKEAVGEKRPLPDPGSVTVPFGKNPRAFTRIFLRFFY